MRAGRCSFMTQRPSSVRVSARRVDSVAQSARCNSRAANSSSRPRKPLRTASRMSSGSAVLVVRSVAMVSSTFGSGIAPIERTS